MDWRKVIVEAVNKDGTASELVIGEDGGSVVIWQDELSLWLQPDQANALAIALVGYAEEASTPKEPEP